ncbi:hypothetical protein IKF87_00775 [Candidatus Saccharibacteria bacterium]|nr:hypothetical protein [Candidatus Saccharibacteria bacterium]
MKTKLTKIIAALSLITLSAVSLNVFVVNPTYAVDCNDSSISQAVRDAAGCNNGSTLPGVIVNILNAIILVGGIVAAVFIVVGGFNYMTSAGDAGKVAKAKNTIIYALIGLVVCVLAFAIVNWAIGTLDKAA